VTATTYWSLAMSLTYNWRGTKRLLFAHRWLVVDVVVFRVVIIVNLYSKIMLRIKKKLLTKSTVKYFVLGYLN